MNQVIFPLKPQMQGRDVANLQDALLVALERKALFPRDEAARRELLPKLQRERSGYSYTSATEQLVARFQKERGLRASGEVDESTAKALNELMATWSANSADGAAPSAANNPRYVVVCRIVDMGDAPLAGVRVEAFDQDPASPNEPLGAAAISAADGSVTFHFRRSDFTEGNRERGPDLCFVLHQGELELSYTLPGVRNDDGVIRNFQQQREPIVVRVRRPQTLQGAIFSQRQLPLQSLKVRLYRRDFGGSATLLREATTASDGSYSFVYDSIRAVTSLEVRAVKADGTELLLSNPMHDVAGSRSGLNLIAPAELQPLRAEYGRLTTDLLLHVGQLQRLATAQEDAARQDLTVLNRVTGWDARLIGFAALSERLAADTEVQLPGEAVYGLLRAGLPSNKQLLAQVDPEVVQGALRKVRDAGIITLDEAAVRSATTRFSTFAANARLALPAPGSQSTYRELLRSSGIPTAAQDKFAAVRLQYRDGGAALWNAAVAANIEPEHIGKLQLQGKLAFLAGNSAPMTTRLLGKGIDDPVQLVQHDLHDASRWQHEVFEQAGIPRERRGKLTEADRQQLSRVIPEAYTAADVETRLDLYSQDMARKVRLSYPTQVLGRLLETDQRFVLPTAHAATVKLFNAATQRGFRLGATPFTSFIEGIEGLDVDLSDVELRSAEQQVRALQRVWQITPSNDAMPVLFQLNISSAFDVMAYSQEEFIPLFEARYRQHYGRPAPAATAVLVHSKSRQVSSITYNLFAIAKRFQGTPPVAGMSAPIEVREQVKQELLKQYPTLESLFGSLDFCECEHCRSVLSPAAYLVDLLQFIDTETGEGQSPYTVLMRRRPDLANIALTCENTHTALPYIDIVNEIFEYYVANGSLVAEAAHDTGDVPSAELLAEPQNVELGAYETLRDARYPLNLPFDLSIETVRQFCNYSETPLHRLLEALRASDALFAPAQTFDRAAIFMESLGLSAAEVALFTNPDPLAKWPELYGFEPDADEEATQPATDPAGGQRVDLNSAKALARRLGVTYQELTDIVQCEFVNPELAQLAVLYRLRVSVRDAKLYKDEQVFYEANHDLVGTTRDSLTPVNQQRFDALEAKRPGRDLTGWAVVNELAALEQRLAELAGSLTPDADVTELRDAILTIPFGRVLVLADPDTGCNFDKTTVQYADGTAVDSIALLRINLFVRVWRKLGWSIEELDRALTAFLPKAAPLDADHLDKRPLRTALIYLAHLAELDAKLKIGKQSRSKLVTLWSDIPTSGKQSLYSQLFLKRSVLASAPVFDDPLGRYLAKPGVALQTHLLALQGALGLTAEEIAHILADAGINLGSAKLSLANVSMLHRYGLLAKALGLSVRELIVLRQLSGLDPFKPLHGDGLTELQQDHPFCQTLELVRVVEEVKGSGLAIEDVDYLLRHRFDATGKYRSDRGSTLTLLRSLSDDIRAIRADHAIPVVASEVSEEFLRQKLGLMLPPEVVTRFLDMVNTSVELTAIEAGVHPRAALPAASFAGEPRVVAVSYQEVPRQEQALTIRGVLLEDAKQLLQERSTSSKLRVEQLEVLAALLNKVQQLAREFFADHLQQQRLRLDAATGFLRAEDFENLFAPLASLSVLGPEDSPSELEAKRQENEALNRQNQQELQRRRNFIARACLPVLQQRLIRQLVVQTMTARSGADPVLMESLLTDERLLGTPQRLLDAFTAAAQRGLMATFWTSANERAEALPPVWLPDADTGARTATGSVPEPVVRAHLDGYLAVPATGAYRFYIELDKEAAVAELRFRHLAQPLFIVGEAGADHDTLGNGPEVYLELQAGVLYHFALDVKRLNGGEARLEVQGETLPKGPLSQLALYPATYFEPGERAALLLSKALQLVQSMGLSEREIRYLLTHAAAFDDVSLSELPTVPAGDTPTEMTATAQRFARFRRLAAYGRLKRDLAAGSDDLIDVFEATAVDYPLLARLTRRDAATVEATARILSAAPTFKSDQPLARLWEALQVVQRFGVPPAALQGWTSIVNATTNKDRRFEIAREVKEAIKARSSPDVWLRVAQPVFDQLRRRRRDALVAWLLHHLKFERMEQLYEYFLIDPGMEPVVQTSRIRLAIAALQLFIQRCLLNLEREIQPSEIDSEQWEWMKRYRVWEANRKIFLFPENWLEPEFRDDKTHLFSELEGALLQGDVGSDLVEDAFLNYLRKLDELARLDICAMHIEDAPQPELRTVHVIGRTYSQPHKYFYRRYAHQMWTPWEPMSIDPEGDHLAPVVWRDRLYLFWVTFLEKPEGPTPSAMMPGKTLGESSIADVAGSLMALSGTTTVQAQLHWSEYIQGQWTTRESSGFDAPSPLTRSQLRGFSARNVFVHVSKEYDTNDGSELGVFIHLGNPINLAFYLAGRNCVPEQAVYGAPSATPPGPRPENKFSSASGLSANRYSGTGSLKVTFRNRINTGLSSTPAPVTPDVLRKGDAYTLLPCNNTLTLSVAPDAYRDAEDPAAVKMVIAAGLSEISALLKPVFYQDNRHTFFVQPEVTEQTVDGWQDWVPLAPPPEQHWGPLDWLREIVVIPQIPEVRPVPRPGDPWPFDIDRESLVRPPREQDWMANPGLVLTFGEVLVGPRGQPGLELRLDAELPLDSGPLHVNPGSQLREGASVVVLDQEAFAASGIELNAGGLNIVGAAGFNPALAQNFLNRERFSGGRREF